MLMTPDQEPGLPPWQMLHVPAFPQVAAVNAMPPVARLLSTLPSANLLSAPVGTLASQTLNPVAVSAVAGESPVSVVPKRRLAKVEHAWQCEPECSATQMSIEKDTFVFVWSDSMSSAGWIYAESLICSSRAGWLPASMLQQLPPNKRWKRVSKHCEAFHPTQVPVEMGNMILVDVSQAPMGDGWVHAEQVDTATGHGAGVLPCISGWVPIQCIAWGEVWVGLWYLHVLYRLYFDSCWGACTMLRAPHLALHVLLCTARDFVVHCGGLCHIGLLRSAFSRKK